MFFAADEAGGGFASTPWSRVAGDVKVLLLEMRPFETVASIVQVKEQTHVYVRSCSPLRLLPFDLPLPVLPAKLVNQPR